MEVHRVEREQPFGHREEHTLPDFVEQLRICQSGERVCISASLDRSMRELTDRSSSLTLSSSTCSPRSSAM